MKSFELDMEELERLAKAATPGWRRAGSVERYHVFVRCDEALAPFAGRVLLRMNEYFPYEADAAFIAACTPEAVLALIAQARGAAQERARIVALLRAWAAQPERYRDEEALQWAADAIERGEHEAP